MGRTIGNAVFETQLPGLKLARRGKVRDIYDLGDQLLIVATDRISAFDHVLPTPIPDKGRVLNQISAYWFERTRELVPNHAVAVEEADFPEPLRERVRGLAGRATLARKLRMIPVECVVRGYLAGSGWTEYRERGSVCGIPLPAGLEQASRLPEPIFAPATKAESGHDENIPFEQVERRLGADRARRLRELALQLYRFAAEEAAAKGIIIADTKFEFGLDGHELVLADEALTPDSSRFWPASEWRPGTNPPAYDKQYVRDYLESIAWNKEPPVPELPLEVVEGTRRRYLEIFRILTGRQLR